MKDVQFYELFGGIALKNHAFSYFFSKVEIGTENLLTVNDDEVRVPNIL